MAGTIKPRPTGARPPLSAAIAVVGFDLQAVVGRGSGRIKSLKGFTVMPCAEEERPVEQAVFLRPPALAGVEALHATFVQHRYAPHFHDAWTLALVMSGAARFDLEGTTHIAPANSAFLIPPGAVHTGEAATAAGYTYRVLYLDPDKLRQHCGCELRRARHRVPVVIRAPGLTNALRGIHAALPLSCMGLEQGEALSPVLDELHRVVGCDDRTVNDAPIVHPAVRGARDYIREHWCEDFTLDQLAQATGMSAFYLVRRFHEQIGMPPSAYRRALRVQAAQRLLRQGTPPARAAADAGFYDQAHLNRHFKRVTGVTPAQYMVAA